MKFLICFILIISLKISKNWGNFEYTKFLVCEQICRSRVNHGGKNINALFTLINEKSKYKKDEEELEDRLTAMMISNCFRNIDKKTINIALKDTQNMLKGIEFPDRDIYIKLYGWDLIEKYYNNNIKDAYDLITFYNGIFDEYKKYKKEGGVETSTPLLKRKGKMGLFGIGLGRLRKIKNIVLLLFLMGLFGIIIYFIVRFYNKKNYPKKHKKH